MKKIVIIHFNPLELYPPVQNFLNYAREYSFDTRIDVITTATTNPAYKTFKSPSSNIRIIRLGKSGKMHALRRYMNFVIFYSGSLWHLVKKKPFGIFYYETLSSFPAFLYKTVWNRNIKIFIHYHEYTSKEEYTKGTRLLQFFHTLEKKLYSKVQWVSHTNEYRMEHFEKDIYPVVIPVKKILPNYPPVHWLSSKEKARQLPVRIVYIGALSMHTMYTKEFANWVKQQKGRVTWDIYSYDKKENTQLFFNELQCEYIRVKDGVNYEDLPEILVQYDVGVILYNGHILNYVYNAPNKLFEYLACGLDIWFPAVIKGSLPYVTGKTYPRIIATDFSALEHINLEEAIDRKGYHFQPGSFFCENVFGDLFRILLS